MASYTKKSEDLLNSKNISITTPRLILLSLLIKEKRPLTVDQILTLSKGKIAQSTLYRVVSDLKDFGLITEFTTPDNTIVVEISFIAKGDTNHHHHIFCKDCGEITDIALSNELEEHLKEEIIQIQKSLKVLIADHTLELYGLCEKCKH